MLRKLMSVALMSLLFVACQQKSQTQPTSTGGDGQTPQKVTPPNYVSEPSANQTSTPLPTSKATEYRNGEFGARIENAAINTSRRYQDGSGELEGNISLTLFNTGSSPISLIALDGGQITVSLDNGVTLNSNSISGLKSCNNDDLQACQIGQAGEYTQIDPHSDVAVTLSMQANYSTPQAVSLSTIKLGSLSKRLDLVVGPGAGKPITLSFVNFPIKNNTNSQ